MPCVQLNSESTFPALRGIFVKTDLRTKCLLCAAILVVLPLEIHHLLAAFAGAAGYMLLQMLEPAVQRQPVKPRAVKKDRSVATPPPTPLPERRLPRRGFTAAEDEKWSQLRSKATPTAQPPAVKPEVRRPSVMPVQAPRFAASGFEAEVVELLTTLQPNDASRAQVQAIARAVRRALGSALPGAAVEAFATANPVSGTAFGVAVPEVEVVVTLDAKATSGEGGKLQKSMIRTCTDRLVSQGSFKFRRSAFRGPEPKVTLIAPAEEGSIPFNLAVNATTPGRAALLFEASSRLHPKAGELILLVRRWAKDRGISHAAKGHLSPYCWMILAIYYLQVGPDEESGELLPPLSGLSTGKMPAPLDYSEKTSPTAARLLRGFMNFYAGFAWGKEVISVCKGKRTWPSASRPAHVLLHEDGKTKQPGPNIEDPFETTSNLGTCMHWLSMSRLTEELNRSKKLCVAGVSLAELLEPWTPPEQQEE